ncbi:ChaC-like protein, partial [Acaromyces ingoldii]
IVFAYGSLIFKPPPHTIGRTVGYVKGYARRFAQSSNDHRGTPEHPGRVATLVRSSDWAKFIPDDDSPEGDIVWGVAWTIDPRKENEVRAYLDDREKNGYTAQSTPVYGLDENGNENVLMDDALLYVGLPDNEAFVGPAKSLVSLADLIFSCEGPSGRNDDYVLKLATACRLLSPDVADSHLFTLERLLLELRAKHGMSMGIVNQKDQREVRGVV